MNLILSLDYELFFGSWHGSPQRCLIEPCQALLKVTDRVPDTLAFFVDAGYLCKLEEDGRKNQTVQREADQVFRHLAELSRPGHELHLHIHPHWEDTRRGADGWQFDLTRYALHSFHPAQILDIVTRHKNAIARFVAGGVVFGYRAGVIRPFDRLAPALRSNGIWLDRAVFPGGVTEDSLGKRDLARKLVSRTTSPVSIDGPKAGWLEIKLAGYSQYDPVMRHEYLA